MVGGVQQGRRHRQEDRQRRGAVHPGRALELRHQPHGLQHQRDIGVLRQQDLALDAQDHTPRGPAAGVRVTENVDERDQSAFRERPGRGDQRKVGTGGRAAEDDEGEARTGPTPAAPAVLPRPQRTMDLPLQQVQHLRARHARGQRPRLGVQRPPSRHRPHGPGRSPAQPSRALRPLPCIFPSPGQQPPLRRTGPHRQQLICPFGSAYLVGSPPYCTPLWTSRFFPEGRLLRPNDCAALFRLASPVCGLIS
mmetsp:Transcript_10188/g.17787  ORF Transcript_10188/g.17787 Transcript_10188/m.17787 type:complete len:251 (-) Transcript_10188:266-1018(-)